MKNERIFISILVPTKNRIHNIDRLISTSLSKARNPSKIEIIFYVDNDDYTSQQHINSLKNDNIFWTTSEQKVLFSDMWNYAFLKSRGEYVMLCGDDVTFITQNWDEYIEQAFEQYEDKIVYVVPNDGNAGNNLGVHGFLNRKWVDIVGFFTPPYFAYWYADTWIDNVARKIGRFHYLSDVMIIHNHWESPNAISIDSLYLENKSKVNQELHNLWYAKEHERIEQSNKLRNFINDFGDKK